MNRSTHIAICSLLLVLASVPVAAQEDDLRVEVQKLRQGQDELRREIAEIRRLLQQRPTPNSGGVNVAGKVFDVGPNPAKGEASADLTLIEFTDYQCGYCARHLRETFPRISEEFVATDKLRYVVVDMPLQRHTQAFQAAEVARCAGDQGKYWEMHDRLFAFQRALEPWTGHADALGLDRPAFDACLAERKYAEAVRRDMNEARRAGATGTPSFVLARTNPESPDQVTALSFIRGARPFEDFQAQINEALEAAE